MMMVLPSRAQPLRVGVGVDIFVVFCVSWWRMKEVTEMTTTIFSQFFKKECWVNKHKE
jgi:hypothetical protein